MIKKKPRKFINNLQMVGPLDVCEEKKLFTQKHLALGDLP